MHQFRRKRTACGFVVLLRDLFPNVRVLAHPLQQRLNHVWNRYY